MATFLLVLLVFLVIFAAMAVGVIFSNKPIKGSCGGLNNLGLNGECEICGGRPDDCQEPKTDQPPSPLSYDATKR